MRNGMEERELLHTDGLSVGYHGKELIKEIGISLKRGEIVTLIGPNGAGKSTILKTVAKQLQEICGSVYVENTSLCELPEKELAKKMSIVFTELHDTSLQDFRCIILLYFHCLL